MTSLAQSEIFFFISSIGFVVLAILATIILLLCIRAVAIFNRILVRIEESMGSIGDATMELLDDMRESMIFRLFFRSKKSKKSHSKPHDKTKLEN